MLDRILLICGPMVDAPRLTKRHGKHYQVTIGIGPDNHATITMTDEALAELCNIINGNIEDYTK